MKTGQQIIDFIAQRGLVRCNECSPNAVLVWQGQAPEQIDALLAFPTDEQIEEYIRGLHWSKHATDTEVALVVGNIRSFARWMRSPNAPAEAQSSLQPDVGTVKGNL